MFIVESVIGNEIIPRGLASTREDAKYLKKLIHADRIRKIKLRKVI